MSDHHGIFTQFFLYPEVIFSSHTMFINASTKDFTLVHLVTFSPSRTRIRMKFYFVYMLRYFVYGQKVYEWTDSKIQGCYMLLYVYIYIYIYIYIYCNHVMQLHWVLFIIISNLQFTTSKRAISIRYKSIMNIISTKDFYGHYASPSSGEAYRDRRVTTNFELWVEIFCVPTCFHMRIPKPCLSVCPYPEKRNHHSFVNISPTLVIDTSMERSSHEYYTMETQKFDFFLKFEIEFDLYFDLCWRGEIIQVGLNMHLYVDIGDASSSLWGSTSSLNFIPFFIVNTVVFYNYCPTSPSRFLRKLWTIVKGNDWQIKMECVLFLKILSCS